MKYGRCEPDYCACDDFFQSLRAFYRGEYDHLIRKGPKMTEFREVPAVAGQIMPFGSPVKRGEGDRLILAQISLDRQGRLDPRLDDDTALVCGLLRPAPRGFPYRHRGECEVGEEVSLLENGGAMGLVDGLQLWLEFRDGKLVG